MKLGPYALLATGFAALSPVAHAGIIAYDIPAGSVGVQNFGGSVGMEFDVRDASGINVTHVGVFDSGSDGINGSLNVAMYNRITEAPLAGASASLNGTDGAATGGHRFVELGSPVHLAGGFRGVIAADGYNGSELLGNGIAGRTTDGGGALEFVGLGRWLATPGFPTNIDGGPANRYAAGSFMFENVPDAAGPANALQAPDGTVGTQTYGGSLGITFIVTQSVTVDALAAFDSGGDGFSGSVTTELWTRSGGNGDAILGSQTFTAGSPGALADGHRYQPLASPLTLAPGEYAIVAYGFSADDPNGNIGTGNDFSLWDTQNGALEFVGSAYGAAGAYPANADARPAQYLAGSFSYTVVPEPAAGGLLATALLLGLARRRRS